MGKRKEATEYALKMISLIDPSGINTDIRRKELEELSDEQFDQLMQTYASGKDRLPLIAPNFGKVNLDVERNIELAKEHFNHSFFQQIVHHSQDPDTPSYVGEPKYLVMEMPYRRTMQLLVEGISVASHNNSIDQRTGAAFAARALRDIGDLRPDVYLLGSCALGSASTFTSEIPAPNRVPTATPASTRISTGS